MEMGEWLECMVCPVGETINAMTFSSLCRCSYLTLMPSLEPDTEYNLVLRNHFPS